MLLDYELPEDTGQRIKVPVRYNNSISNRKITVNLSFSTSPFMTYSENDSVNTAGTLAAMRFCQALCPPVRLGKVPLSQATLLPPVGKLL